MLKIPLTGSSRFRPLLSALALAAAVLAGCETFETPRAVARGEAEEVLVATDSATWAGPVGEALRAELGRPIATLPSGQGAFRLRRVDLSSRSFPTLKLAPHIVFAAPIDTPGEIGDFLRSRVGEGGLDAVRSGQAAAVDLRPDLWADRQLVTVATAASDSALAAQILKRGPELRAAYGRLARERTADEMFARLRQTDLEDEMLAEHGFRVGVQHDFVKVQDTTVTVAGRTGAFVRYRRVLSGTWRDFFVFAEDGVERLPPKPELDRLTDALLEEFARGVYDSSYVQTDDQRPTTTDTVTVAGRTALETRGLWYMTNDVMGGAYIREAFVDPATDRLYVYYGMTFAPDRTLDKRKFLRQMEAIAHTFQTRADVREEPGRET